ncbi:MAG: hypothetical protein KC912_24035 [Proteobacteria bacterium]|nr:hypothetical protein [Pseudomonadota bacterium]
MSSIRISALCALVATSAACTPDYAPWRTGDPKAPTAYRYVMGADEATGTQRTGGAHTVIVPSQDRDVREAIDAPNTPSRLHPELKGDYTLFDADITSGESDWDIFASSWWAQSKNGIAKRWTGGTQSYSDHSQVDNMSPSEKYDVLFNPGQPVQVEKVEHHDYPELRKPEDERADKHEHEAITVVGPATAWELKNHGNYQSFAHPDHWWGHCNGWASYATAEKLGAPTRDIRVKVDDDKIIECASSTEEGCVLVRMGDIEALMSELYFSDTATFAGRRCKESPDEMERDEYGRPTDPACRDMNPGTFHIAVTGLLARGAENMSTKEQGRPAFIIDHSYDWEVWNFPLKKFKVHTTEEVTAEEANALVGAEGEYSFNVTAERFARVHLSYWMVSDGVSDSKMLKQADDRDIPLHEVELNYVLEMTADGTIVGGEWIEEPEVTHGEDSKKLHPDFLWAAVNPQGWGEQSDDLGGDDDNPHIAYSKVQALLACSNDASTCAAVSEPEPEPATCAGQCDSSAAQTTASGAVCYCDAACTSYNDCCDDQADTCGGAGTAPPVVATCEGHCGSSSPAPGTECYCDDSCEEYGDCCSDKSDTCQ